MVYGPRVAQALGACYRYHAAQERKGAAVPYLTHLLSVAAIVGEYGGDEDQFIAALLHDAVEDAGGASVLAEIRTDYGDRVAEIVLGCTDTDETPKPPWRPRKEAFIASIAHAPQDARLIISADKLHNIRSTVTELRRRGAVVWQHFTGGRDGTLWYYEAVVQALAHEWPHPILDELADAVISLKQAADFADQHRGTEPPCTDTRFTHS